MMDVHSISQTPLLFLTFLQQRPCQNSELQRELDNLRCEVKLSAAPSGHIAYPQDHVFDSDVEHDGELQADGHSFHRGLHDVAEAELVLPVPAEEADVVREVAAELVRIADEFNHAIVSQVAENLTNNLTNSSFEYWWSSLNHGVDCLLDGSGMHTEQMVMALTFSLARAVCERAPHLLRGLCNTMMQSTFRTRPR
ncbi:BH3 interacting domain death agonist [Neoarius graeffei]|uniref:BH3 interacting domain death agonist n=1 Tax=Neoarius graeffei TaxID=443677 RepID=UPI00298CC9CE|nr:BH3 interacting domain death agonist [Neoarius graeffei]